MSGYKNYIGQDFINHFKCICPFCRSGQTIESSVCKKCGVAFPMLTYKQPVKNERNWCGGRKNIFDK